RILDRPLRAAVAAIKRKKPDPLQLREDSHTGILRRAGQLVLGQERQEALGLKQVALPATVEGKLLEDRGRRCVTPVGLFPPFGLQPLAQLRVAVVAVEDLANVQLRRDGAVPLVLLESEGDVIAADVAKPVELGAEAEGDRAARVAPVVADAEAQMLPLAD